MRQPDSPCAARPCVGMARTSGRPSKVSHRSCRCRRIVRILRLQASSRRLQEGPMATAGRGCGVGERKAGLWIASPGDVRMMRGPALPYRARAGQGRQTWPGHMQVRACTNRAKACQAGRQGHSMHTILGNSFMLRFCLNLHDDMHYDIAMQGCGLHLGTMHGLRWRSSVHLVNSTRYLRLSTMPMWLLLEPDAV